MVYDRLARITGTNATRKVCACVPCVLVDDGEVDPLGGEASVDKKAHRYTLAMPLAKWRDLASVAEPLPGFSAEVVGVARMLVDSVVSLGGEILMVSCTAAGGPVVEAWQ